MSEKLILSNLFTSALAKWANLDMMYAMSISSILIGYISAFDVTSLSSVEIPVGAFWYLKLFIVVATLAILSTAGYTGHKWWTKKVVQQTKYKFLSLYELDKIWYVTNYMEKEHQFFDIPNLEYGNKMYPATDELFFPVDGSRVDFNDTLYRVKGYMQIGYDSKKDGDKEKERLRFIQIHIEVSCSKTPLQYFRCLQDYRREQEEKRTDMQVYGVKLISNRHGEIYNIVSTIFNGEKDSEKKRYQQNMMTYFSPIRDLVWESVAEVHYHPEHYTEVGQIPGKNILLYGPPGTGKSTLARRIAVSLGRHLISMNMIDYLDRKKKLHSIMARPYFNNTCYKPTQVVLLLEEFDNVVRYLEEQDVKPDWSHLYTMHNPLYLATQKKEEKEKKTKSFKGTLDGPEEKDDEETGSGGAKKEKEKKFSVGESYKLHLNDLLEIFQGPNPVPGLIIVATTNHFPYIKKTLPALVREGRLTPIHADYLDWDSFCELVQFYFKSQTTLHEIQIKMPTSAIIEMAMKYRLKKGGLALFESEFSGRATIQ
ncbi:MAG: AAA family ATPase [Candidatus Thorarchaeota archaeon]|jgi:hypothetical protein